MPISMCIGTIDLSSVSENEVIKVNARRINWSVKLDLLRECDQTYGSCQLAGLYRIVEFPRIVKITAARSNRFRSDTANMLLELIPDSCGIQQLYSCHKFILRNLLTS